MVRHKKSRNVSILIKRPTFIFGFTDFYTRKLEQVRVLGVRPSSRSLKVHDPEILTSHHGFITKVVESLVAT